MANVIKHKRGSGSDPSASNLVVGELAIRTDTGKLFTKMDSGSIAEIAGGGSDIAINTLSSSSATGGGSATFNGSAYRFTLSSPPSVSAQQLLVSINGVIQKPVAGTGQPSEGFSVSGNDIILGDAPAAGSDFFILTFRSLGVSEPADNSVTSAKIVDGAIVNADINASAAIAGTKISSNFGSQNVQTTGSVIGGGMTISNAQPKLTFTDTNHNSDFRILVEGGNFQIEDTTNSNADRLVIDSSGKVGIGTTSPGYRLDLGDGTSGNDPANGHQFRINAFGDYIFALQKQSTSSFSIRNNGTSVVHLNTQNSKRLALGVSTGSAAGSIEEHVNILSSGNVGIGTTSPSDVFDVVHAANTAAGISIRNTNNSQGSAFAQLLVSGGDNAKGRVKIETNGAFHTIDEDSNGNLIIEDNGTERLRVDSSGRVQIGSTNNSSTGTKFVVGSGNNLAATALINTQDTDIKALQLSNWDGNATTHKVMIGFDNSGHGAFDIGMPAQSADFAIQSIDGERMRITRAGLVGIGTTSPGSVLHVDKGLSGSPLVTFHQTNGNSSADAGLEVETSSTGTYIQRWVNSGSEKMRVTGNGLVGIGTTTIGNKLQVHEASGNASFAGFSNNTTGSTSSDGLIVGLDSDENGVLYHYENKAIRFATNNAERMRIHSDGKVNIGSTETSTGLLLLDKNLSASSDVSDKNNYHLVIRSQANDNTSKIGIAFADTSDDDSVGAAILHHRTGGGSVGDLAFYTSPSDGTTTERVRIEKDGEVGINVTDPEAYGANGHGYGGLTVEAPSGNFSGITVRSNFAGGGALFFADGSGSNAERKNLGFAADHVNKRMNFIVEGSTVCRFTANGFHPNPADSSASTALDDYEEGYWSPTAVDGQSLHLQNSGNVAARRYVKIGKLVTCWFDINFDSGNSGSGQTRFSGLPFAKESSSEGSGAPFVIGYYAGSETYVVGHSDPSNHVKFFANGSAVWNYSASAGDRIAGCITYIAS